MTDPRVRRGEVPRSAARATEADTAYLRGLYDAEIADLDAEIGRLLDAVDRRGLLERTVAVLAADHGEEFREHGGFGHGRTLYREQLHVPLIVRLVHHDPPRHLFAFGPRSLGALLDRVGFTVERVGTFSLEQGPSAYCTARSTRSACRATAATTC